jgi:hypothetical protein
MPKVQCIICEHWRNEYECKSLSSSTYGWFHEYLRSTGKIFTLEMLYFCKGCKRTFYSMRKELSVNLNSVGQSPSQEPEAMDVENDEKPLTLDNLKFRGSGHKKCVICCCNVSSKMMVMPKTARLELLAFHRVYAPEGFVAAILI